MKARDDGEGVWWGRGVGGPGRHPGCTCPMTGDPAAWHHDDCAAHDPDAREEYRSESVSGSAPCQNGEACQDGRIECWSPGGPCPEPNDPTCDICGTCLDCNPEERT